MKCHRRQSHSWETMAIKVVGQTSAMASSNVGVSYRWQHHKKGNSKKTKNKEKTKREVGKGPYGCQRKRMTHQLISFHNRRTEVINFLAASVQRRRGGIVCSERH